MVERLACFARPGVVPLLLMADGTLTIWSAVGQVWPETSHQRCWNHKIINVLDDLPKCAQSKA